MPRENCRWSIEKLEGDDHITCSKCRHEFCWNCLASYQAIRDKGSSEHATTCVHHSNQRHVIENDEVTNRKAQAEAGTKDTANKATKTAVEIQAERLTENNHYEADSKELWVYDSNFRDNDSVSSYRGSQGFSSSALSSATSFGLHLPALTDQFVSVVLEDAGMKSLLSSGFDLMSRDRFERNIRRLLRRYALNLLKSASNEIQTGAAKYIRNQSRLIANRILYTFIHPEYTNFSTIDELPMLSGVQKSEHFLEQAVPIEDMEDPS
ncbi:uncharacterized protein BDZ99DRAFT_241443 [Mytilinidion resinicola]|uniref:RING-type domain-containing protein n=1 Tax=Mytilinidion resinicola TaxID=574789 RepID=A0A6A6Y0C9_9PEZI|nr:uncharacterized protein BDZ99DRAFT_241443 [Mytilinidion resinicola]KAF2801267.1 hypothetical protein BDZ99DRAFT_241443 [Mytilinidion resinicola]